MAKKSGLDLRQVVDVISAGAGGSWQLANLGPKIAIGDYAPGFMVDLLLKDLAIVMDAARVHKLPVSAAALSEGYFRAASAAGEGVSGTHAVAKTVEKLGCFNYSVDQETS